jgi:SecD/SecF fusion protein
LYPKRSLPENINQGINSTLGRTVNTSFTTFFTLLIIFIFGGAVLKGFMFAMMVGIFTGTYTSIFLASTVVLDFGRKKLK